MTRRSPVTTYPSPLEMRGVRKKRGASGGVVLAVVVIVAVYGLAGWLAVRKHDHARPARAADTSAPPALKADLEHHPCAGRTAGIWAPALKADLERHACWGCEP